MRCEGLRRTGAPYGLLYWFPELSNAQLHFLSTYFRCDSSLRNAFNDCQYRIAAGFFVAVLANLFHPKQDTELNISAERKSWQFHYWYKHHIPYPSGNLVVLTKPIPRFLFFFCHEDIFPVNAINTVSCIQNKIWSLYKFRWSFLLLLLL